MTDTFPVDDLNEALRSAGVGIWSWDIPSNVIRWSDVTHAIYDVAPAQFAGDYASFQECIHPEDRQRVEQTIAEAVRGLRQDFAVEHRLVSQANVVKWVEGRGRVVADEAGRPLRMIGTVMDITRRKTSEEELRKGEHILLVEDDGPVRLVIARLLQNRGYRVTAVASSEEALALGEILATVHGLLTDVRMPGQSGLDLAAQLRRLYPQLPVLVMSGHVEDPSQQAQLTEGRYPFIAKPFSNQGLLLRLREVLDRSR